MNHFAFSSANPWMGPVPFWVVGPFAEVPKGLSVEDVVEALQLLPKQARHHAFHDLLHRAGISRPSIQRHDNRQAFQRAFVAQGRGFKVDGECFEPFHLQK